MSRVPAIPPADDGSYRKVPTRLRRNKVLATASPQELGLNSYRAHWLWMIGIANCVIGQFLAAFPILNQQRDAFQDWYLLIPIWILLASAILVVLGVMHAVHPWSLLCLAAAVAAGVLLLPVAWTGQELAQLPWINGFTVAVAGGVALAWSPWAAVVYLVGVETALSLILAHVIRVDLGAYSAVSHLFLHVIYGLIAILVVVLIQTAMDRLDQDYTEALAQELALTRSRSETADQERMDRLIHDNVMAALLDASRSEGPLPKRTRELATRALEVLDDENSRLSGRTSTMVHDLMGELLDSLSPWRSRVRFSNLRTHIRPVGEPRVFVPTFVAHGLTQAITEAVSNSARHSNADVTYVSMDGGPCPPTETNPEGFFLRFAIQDDGEGFALHEVDTQRLGVRVSIMENIESIGGDVSLNSAPGRGTSVIITWPKDAQL